MEQVQEKKLVNQENNTFEIPLYIYISLINLNRVIFWSRNRKGVWT